MAKKTAYKRYPGVYYTESKVRQWRDRPDRCLWIAFKDPETKKLRWERCGWLSEGWTPEKAQNRRHKLLTEVVDGKYTPPAKRKAAQITFATFMEEHYLPWAWSNKRSAKDDANRYDNWLKPHIGRLTLAQVTPFQLEKVKKVMRDAGRKPATIRHVLALVRHAFNKARQWRLYEGQNPVDSVRLPSVSDNKRLRFLTHEEAHRLLEALALVSRQTHDEALLALHCGLRFGEIASLTWGDIDFENDIIHIKTSKTGFPRQVYMTRAVRDALLDRLPADASPSDLVFPARNGGKKTSVSKAFFRVVEKLGLNEGVTDPRDRVVFHTLRHTFASWLVIEGTPLLTVARLMGHTTTQMTERYSHLAPDHKRAAVERMARVFEEAVAGEQGEVVELKR